MLVANFEFGARLLSLGPQNKNKSPIYKYLYDWN